MTDDVAKEKWNKIYDQHDSAGMQPAKILSDYEFLLPNKGTALDLACGFGVNSIYLAKRGLDVHAWDISEKAIKRLDMVVKEKCINIKTEVRDVLECPPKKNSFDVICISYFLERKITQKIISALKQNGLLFYQTFIHEKVSMHGPNNPNYRLGENELLNLFSALHVLVYQEHGKVGNTMLGIRDTAIVIAQKRNII